MTRRGAPLRIENQTSHQRPHAQDCQKTEAPSPGTEVASPRSWQIQTAKVRFSQLFRQARTSGPQRITRQGKEGVIMIAEEQYEQLLGKSHQRRSLVEFFHESPLVGVDLDLKREN